MTPSGRSPLHRLLAVAMGGALAALVVLGAGTTAASAASAAAPKPSHAPLCPPMTVEDSTRTALAVFSGTVTDVQKQPRTDGVPGALYEHEVTVIRVYQGDVHTEAVTVRTDRNRTGCSLGALTVGKDYMFFVAGNGDPWVASGTSGTRVSNDKVTTKVEGILGPGDLPVTPASEKAKFTPVDTSEPQTLSRAAAPGAALVIVGLLGLAVVRGISRRAR